MKRAWEIVVLVLGPLAFLAMLGVCAVLEGCAPAEPVGAVELEASAAMDVVFAAMRSDVAHPGVFGVPSDCSDFHDGGQGFGFWLDGACRGGYTSDQRVYTVLRPQGGTLFSDHAAHEARHWAAGGGLVDGDTDPGHTSPTFFSDVAAAQAALLASDVNVVRVGAGGFDRGAR